MAEVFCNNCGHRNPDGSNFCSSCGHVLERVEESAPTITFTIDQNVPAETVDVDVAEVGPGGVLLVTRGPNSGSEFALEHVITSVGRHPDSDVFLDDVTVSRRHAEIQRTSSGHIVRDVGSLNGTYLNQKMIDGDTPFTSGDELQVGRFKLAFVAEADS